MGKMKLYYFNLRGRAEFARLILAQAGADYEDKRVEREEWPTLKPTMPGGQMPVLEVDGIQLSQSITIARFLANKYKLAGSTPLEQAKADMVVDCGTDFFTALAKVMFEKDDAKKKELQEKMKNETVPAYLKHMTEILTKNGGLYMVGKGLTWADIGVSMMIEIMSNEDSTLLTKCPPLGDLMKRVHSQPRIKAWMEKRPKTDM
jgi:glutathione S-transferase